MSYRTTIEGIQLFGNNESYPQWIEFIKSQGISVSADGCYEGDITDFMGAVKAVEEIVMELHQQREKLREKYGENMGRIPLRSLFDLSYIVKQVNSDPETSLLDELIEATNQSYAFLPYTLMNACEHKLENAHMYSTPGHMYCYKVKEGEKLHVRAR